MICAICDAPREAELVRAEGWDWPLHLSCWLSWLRWIAMTTSPPPWGPGNLYDGGAS